MYSKPLALKLIRFAVFAAVMSASFWLGLAWGVEKKSWFEMSWELITGSAVGAISGILFYGFIGAIGWVSGALYGAIGVVSLIFGGAVGGLGLGSFINFLRNPQEYNVNWLILGSSLLVGIILATILSRLAVRLADRHLSSTAPAPRRIS